MISEVQNYSKIISLFWGTKKLNSSSYFGESSRAALFKSYNCRPKFLNAGLPNRFFSTM